jgi:hypothetical protein
MWATIEHTRMPEKTLNSFEVIGEAIGACAEKVSQVTVSPHVCVPLNWNMPRINNNAVVNPEASRF